MPKKSKELTQKDIEAYNELITQADVMRRQLLAYIGKLEWNDEDWKPELTRYIIDCCRQADYDKDIIERKLRQLHIEADLVLTHYNKMKAKLDYALKLAGMIGEALQQKDNTAVKAEYEKLKETKLHKQHRARVPNRIPSFSPRSGPYPDAYRGPSASTDPIESIPFAPSAYVRPTPGHTPVQDLGDIQPSTNRSRDETQEHKVKDKHTTMILPEGEERPLIL